MKIAIGQGIAHSTGGAVASRGYTNKVLALSPIAYWPMAEASGSVAIDASGNGRNGAYSGVTLGATGIGDGRTAATFDGATSYTNVYSASLAGAFSGAQGSIVIWGRVSGAGIWTDGISRRMLLLQADANNRIGINKAVANNEIDWLYVAGSVSKSAGVTSFSPAGNFCIGLTWDKAGDAVKFYVSGAQSGATQTGLGVFAGALSSTQTIIGALNTTPAQVWGGMLAHAAIWTRALSAAEMLTLATL